ncbi:hypothetical protein M427DRAFT_74380 [Gonapodya prolifera JEL478]|uniref:RING-type domain-containing protein n=1 Tax=Gonapodya prolifera (strain JEL478) TaxID=1344416 RepID=A0A139A0F3_GONPJ|nr:hypothetical protein M427DRAFT_74380 [Gonapodya prolifera JEL478]|eukprot:KXS10239.1 hypothetical protein M427DRAFT_74380 [Gonapodya prolifera JEL478]
MPVHRNEISATLDALEGGSEVEAHPLIEAGADPDARKTAALPAKVDNGLLVGFRKWKEIRSCDKTVRTLALPLTLRSDVRRINLLSPPLAFFSVLPQFPLTPLGHFRFFCFHAMDAPWYAGYYSSAATITSTSTPAPSHYAYQYTPGPTADQSPQQQMVLIVAMCVFGGVIGTGFISMFVVTVRRWLRARAILAPLRLQNPDLYNQLIWSSGLSPPPAVPWSSIPAAVPTAPIRDIYHGATVDPSSLARMTARRVSILTTGGAVPGASTLHRVPFFSWPFCHVSKPDPISAAPRVPATVKQSSHVSVLTTCTTSTPLCPICLDTLRTPGAILRTLYCSHVFHAQCVDAWLVGWRGVCPVCRRDLTKEQDDVDVQDGVDGAEIARMGHAQDVSGVSSLVLSRLTSWLPSRGDHTSSPTPTSGQSPEMVPTTDHATTTGPPPAADVVLDIVAGVEERDVGVTQSVDLDLARA